MDDQTREYLLHLYDSHDVTQGISEMLMHIPRDDYPDQFNTALEVSSKLLKALNTLQESLQENKLSKISLYKRNIHAVLVICKEVARGTDLIDTYFNEHYAYLDLKAMQMLLLGISKRPLGSAATTMRL